MFCLILASAIFMAPVAAAEIPAITVEIDGYELEFDVPPRIIDGRTMVPLRTIFEHLGGYVYWEEEIQMVTAVWDETIIIMQIDVFVMRVNDWEVVIDTPPVIIDGRTLVPVRAIAEALGMDVNWDDDTRTVIVTSLLSVESEPEIEPEISTSQ